MQIGCEDNRDQQCRKVESGTAGRRYNVISTVDCVDNVVNCRLDLLNDDGYKLIVCLARTRRQNALTCSTELDYTRNSAIADRSRVSCVHKVTTVIKQLIEMTIKGDSSHRKGHGSTERIWFPITVPQKLWPYLVSFPTVWSKMEKFTYPPVFNAPEFRKDVSYWEN